MRKTTLSIACALAIGLSFSGCGSSGGGGVAASKTSSVDVKTLKLGKDSVVETPSSSEVVSDDYAYTKSDLGIVSLVKASTPVKVSKDDLSDDKPSDILKQKSSSSYTVASKVIKIPITSNDGKVAMLIDFSPKLTFDTTASITNYNSLIALPNNGLDMLKQGLIPISSISSDIAFYGVDGKRIWDINDKFKKAGTTLGIYLVFSSKNNDIGEGNYTLAYYDDNGSITTKDINIAKSSNGTMTVALDKVAPFIIAKKSDGNTSKEINVLSSLDKTDLNLSVVALDKDGNVIGIGKVNTSSLPQPPQTDINGTSNSANLVYFTKTPSKYKLVSYLLKKGYKEFDTNSTPSITKDDIDPQYILADDMSAEDSSTISQIKSEVQYYENDISIQSFAYPETEACGTLGLNKYDNQEFCNKLHNKMKGILDGTLTITPKSSYTIKDNSSDDNITCTVSTKDNNTSVTVKCVNGDDIQNTYIADKKKDDKNQTYFDISYTLNTEHWSENGSYKLYSNNGLRIAKDVSDTYSESYNSNTESSGESSYSDYSGNRQITTKIQYKKGLYYFTRNGSYSYSSSYKNEVNETVSDSKAFSYDLSKQAYLDFTEKQGSYSAKIYNMSGSADVKDLVGKTLIVTKDSNGLWHINNSISGF